MKNIKMLKYGGYKVSAPTAAICCWWWWGVNYPDHLENKTVPGTQPSLE